MSQMVLAFLGTDGSGKTTILNSVLPEIEKATGKRVIVQHLKPDFLPPLGRLRGVKHAPGYVCTTPHASKPSGLIGSLLRITYLTIDYFLGYWLKVRRAVKKDDVACWIFDRYAYDMMMDPLRFRLSLPRWIISFYLRLIPKPDLVIGLVGDPVKIHTRKPETTEADVAAQIMCLQRFAAEDKRIRLVDTTTTIEESVNATLKELDLR